MLKVKMNGKINLFFPQWQGGGNSLDLFNGADLIFKYLDRKTSFLHVPVSTDRNLNIKNNIYGYDVILNQLKDAKQVLNNNNPEKIFTIGGGCGVEVPILSYLANKYADFDVFWFDAHGDLNTPFSSPSNYYHGMPLRFLLEDIKNSEISKLIYNINPNNLFMIGLRDLDDEEIKYIKENKIKIIAIDEINTLGNRIKKGRYGYIHIDLDVLDPGEYPNVKYPVKNGLSVDKLYNTINLINNNYEIIGLSILESIETNLSNLDKIDCLFEFGLKELN
jgi:arginase